MKRTERERGGSREATRAAEAAATKVCRVSSPSFPHRELEAKEEAERLTFLSTSNFVGFTQFGEL